MGEGHLEINGEVEVALYQQGVLKIVFSYRYMSLFSQPDWNLGRKGRCVAVVVLYRVLFHVGRLFCEVQALTPIPFLYTLKLN